MTVPRPRCRHDHRHARVHEPRAGQRQCGRPPDRHLGVRLRPLRDANGAARIRRRDGVGDHRSSHRARSGSEGPPSSPTAVGVRLLLRRCLTKDPRRRQRDSGDVRLDLDQANAEPRGDEALALAASPKKLRLWMSATAGARARSDDSARNAGLSTVSKPTLRKPCASQRAAPPDRSTLRHVTHGGLRRAGGRQHLS